MGKVGRNACCEIESNLLVSKKCTSWLVTIFSNILETAGNKEIDLKLQTSFTSPPLKRGTTTACFQEEGNPCYNRSIDNTCKIKS